MSKESKKNIKIDRKRDIFDYEEFIHWVARPKPLRVPKTQRDLAKKHGIAEETLSRWKNKEGFWDEVRKEIKQWARDKTPNVINAIYQKIIRQGGAAEAKLWLEYIEGWAEKSEFKGEIQNTEIKFTPEEEELLAKIIKRQEEEI